MFTVLKICTGWNVHTGNFQFSTLSSVCCAQCKVVQCTMYTHHIHVLPMHQILGDLQKQVGLGNLTLEVYTVHCNQCIWCPQNILIHRICWCSQIYQFNMFLVFTHSTTANHPCADFRQHTFYEPHKTFSNLSIHLPHIVCRYCDNLLPSLQ